MSQMNKVLATTAFVLAILIGCNDTSSPAKNEVRQEYVEQTAPTSEYRGQGRLVKREVKHWRIFTPFGVSPGETLSRAEPMTIDEGIQPGIQISPGSIESTKGGSGSVVAFGGRFGIIDTIWAWIKKVMWFGVIGIVLLIAVMFLVPGAAPICSGILRGIASIFPFVGSIVESIIARVKLKKPLEQTVEGGEQFKTKLANGSTSLSPDQKTEVLALFKESQLAAQDTSTKKLITEIKR